MWITILKYLSCLFKRINPITMKIMLGLIYVTKILRIIKIINIIWLQEKYQGKNEKLY